MLILICIQILEMLQGRFGIISRVLLQACVNYIQNCLGMVKQCAFVISDAAVFQIASNFISPLLAPLAMGIVSVRGTGTTEWEQVATRLSSILDCACDCPKSGPFCSAICF